MQRSLLQDNLVITIEELEKAYGGKKAVAGISLNIHAGEVFAILGPNGAGKSTMVEILEGFRRRDSGNVRVLGEDPAERRRGWRSRIGVVLQNSMDKPELTVVEMVDHYAGFYANPMPTVEVIESVGLTEKARAKVGRLSGGQRRRLDVALAIVGRPELLFLDEPTTGFDPEARQSFWALIESLKLDGVTIVLTTHYLDEAERLADRIAVVADGKLVALDTVANLFASAEGEAVVRWRERKPNPNPNQGAASFDGASAERAMEERTRTPMRTLREIEQRLSESGQLVDGEIPGLQILRPTLEDIYLSLIVANTATNEALAHGGTNS